MNIAKASIQHKVATLLAVIMITVFGCVFATQLQMAEKDYSREVCPLLEACYRDLGNFQKAYEYACTQRK